MSRTALQRDVADAALALDEPYRTTLLLRYQGDLSYRAIAARMQVPVETVRTRIKRALRQLRRSLDARFGDRRAWAVPILGVRGFEQALAQAGSAAATGAAGAGVPGAAGVALMGTQAKVIVAAGIAVAVLAAWQLWPESAMLPGPEAASARGTPAVAVGGAESDPDHPSSRDVEAGAGTRTEVAAGAASAAPGPDGEGPWLLTGRVLDDATGAPVAGAAMSIHGPYPVPSSTADEPVTTDGEGRFAFPLRTRAYGTELRATRDGYAPAFASLQEILVAINRDVSGHGPPGPPRSSFEIPDVRLLRGQLVTGRVVEADGSTPVAGATVLHCRTSFGVVMHPFANAREVAKTGADGAFSLVGRYAPDSAVQYLYAVSDHGIGWRTLQVSRREGAARRQDIELRPTAAVRVEVVDGAGRPIAGVPVTAIPLFQPLGFVPPWNLVTSMQSPPALFHGHTDASGQVELARLPVGDDGVQQGRPIAGGSYAMQVHQPGYRLVELPATLWAGADLRQRVVLASQNTDVDVRGEVLDDRGWPVAGATVELLWNDTATTGSDGTFVAEGIRSSRSPIPAVVRAAGYVTERRLVELDGDPELRLTFRLARAMPVRGRVVDQDGRPVAGAAVWLGEQADLECHMLADSEGRFAFEGAPPGQHVLRVSAQPEDGIPAAVTVTVDNREEPQDVIVRMHRFAGPLAAVEFVVCDTAGRPLEPTSIGLTPLDENRDFAGTVVALSPFVGGARADGVPPGRYLLRVETREGHRGSRAIEIPEGVAQVREHVALEAPGSVVVTADLSAVPAAAPPRQLRVELTPRGAGRFGARHALDVGDRRLSWFCLDLTQGSDFDLEGLEPGVPCTLTVREEGLAGELELDVAPGERAAARLRVRPR